MNLLEISQLPLREKFQVMEAIWADLRGPLESSDDVPESHQQLLDARHQRVASGEARVLDWDQVKSSIGTR